MDIFTLPSAPERFVMALEGLYGAVAARIRAGVMSGLMILAVCGRIRRAERQVLQLLTRFRSGWRPVARTRTAGGRGGTTSPSTGGRLPRRFGWLIALVPYEAANFASQLRHTLAAPEMRALLAAVPQARRALAPVCRMLAIEPEALTPEVGAGPVELRQVDAAERVGPAAAWSVERGAVRFRGEPPPAFNGPPGRAPPVR